VSRDYFADDTQWRIAVERQADTYRRRAIAEAAFKRRYHHNQQEQQQQQERLP